MTDKKLEHKYLEVLRKRRDHLTKRISESKQDLSYDKVEKAALDWAISRLSVILLVEEEEA